MRCSGRFQPVHVGLTVPTSSGTGYTEKCAMYSKAMARQPSAATACPLPFVFPRGAEFAVAVVAIRVKRLTPLWQEYVCGPRDTEGRPARSTRRTAGRLPTEHRSHRTALLCAPNSRPTGVGPTAKGSRAQLGLRTSAPRNR